MAASRLTPTPVDWQATARIYEDLFTSLDAWTTRLQDENAELRRELAAVLVRLARYERNRGVQC